MIDFFGYAKCSTCIKAKKYLKEKGVEFNDIEITENPPEQNRLKELLATGIYPLKDFFNKSGQVYREMNLKEKIDSMTETELLALLASNGKLIKRPLIIKDKKFVLGFDPKKVDQLI